MVDTTSHVLPSLYLVYGHKTRGLVIPLSLVPGLWRLAPRKGDALLVTLPSVVWKPGTSAEIPASCENLGTGVPRVTGVGASSESPQTLEHPLKTTFQTIPHCAFITVPLGFL